nr:cell envelope integrity protein CreD [uncultured Dongia sp.]
MTDLNDDFGAMRPSERGRYDPRQWRDRWRGSGFEAAKRILFLGALILLMLIPLGMVEGVVQERSWRKQQVMDEVGEQWGPVQSVSAPILVVPYDMLETRPKADGSEALFRVRHFATFLPAKTRMTAQSKVEKRHKSIYEILVYGAKIDVTGSFASPDFSRWNVPPDQIHWNEASLAILLPGARALQSIELLVDGKPQTVDAGLLPQHPRGQGLRSDLKLSGPRPLTFSIKLAINGRDALSVLPLGGQSEIEMSSDWPHPNFLGSPLPATREIDKDGFVGRWSINHLATGIPLSWRDGEFTLEPTAVDMVGVGLAEPGDVHQQTDRIVKYGLLVVSLTFGTIFIIGLLKRDRVHLVQYLLIGAAISLFYLLLLSLAEQMSFARAYLIASLVDIAIVAGYAGATIRRLVGLLTGLILAALHGYMFVLLQMESYALLSGTIGLLLILVLIMVATRKVDWYAIGEEPAGSRNGRQPAA